ncbi:hypothetical protein ACPESR_25270 [Nocardia testacea]|uniref:hypothetical protein n=1 Tax=Nocardia testacea TaxID=248551 RepID=UPI003C2FF4EF
MRMRLPSVFVAVAAAGLVLSPVAQAFPLGSGSAGAPAPAPEPAGPVVTFGDYCASTYAPAVTTARTADGQTAYCVQVSHTDAYVWWPTPDKIPVDPHNSVRPGDSCLDEGAQWVAPDRRPIVCEKTKNGRMRGDLRWMYQA